MVKRKEAKKRSKVVKMRSKRIKPKIKKKIVKRKGEIVKKNVKEKIPQIEAFDVPEEKKSNILPTLFVVIIILVGIGYLLYSYRDVFLINYFKDVLEVHPELENNEKIIEFLNKYENRIFREQVKGEYLYITIWSKDRKDCIVAVEDPNKNVKQIIEPNNCDENSLKKL